MRSTIKWSLFLCFQCKHYWNELILRIGFVNEWLNPSRYWLYSVTGSVTTRSLEERTVTTCRLICTFSFVCLLFYPVHDSYYLSIPSPGYKFNENTRNNCRRNWEWYWGTSVTPHFIKWSQIHRFSLIRSEIEHRRRFLDMKDTTMVRVGHIRRKEVVTLVNIR